jgi:hypothetical protein
VTRPTLRPRVPVDDLQITTSVSPSWLIDNIQVTPKPQ